jgi:hypothetical protein
MGLGNRFAQEVDQRGVDTGVCDATGREKKFQDAAPCRLDLMSTEKASPVARSTSFCAIE